MTCGPYRPITLTTYTLRIKDVHAKTKVLSQPDGRTRLTLNVDVILVGRTSPSVHGLVVKLLNKNGDIVMSGKANVLPNSKDAIDSPEGVVHTDIVVWKDLQDVGVELWWPVGYGEQNLYTVDVTLFGQVRPMFFSSLLLLTDSLPRRTRQSIDK